MARRPQTLKQRIALAAALIHTATVCAVAAGRPVEIAEIMEVARAALALGDVERELVGQLGPRN
jgi:hypothetical protein